VPQARDAHNPPAMPLRLLLLLMALVSASMIAAVIYTKVLNPPGRREATIIEVKAINRLCAMECEEKAPKLAPTAGDEASMVALVDQCIGACIDRVKLGRGLN
jgi:hypothetical protein